MDKYTLKFTAATRIMKSGSRKLCLFAWVLDTPSKLPGVLTRGSGCHI